jgi:DNA-binding MarR family transcriptional regulator
VALIDVAAWGLERSLSLAALAEFEQDSNGHEFMKRLLERPGQSNTELADGIGISNAEVSRVGRRLADAGLAAKRRLGRYNHWELTPKGIHALELLAGGGAARFHRPHLQIR